MNPDKTVTELVNLSKKQVKDNDDILTFQALTMVERSHLSGILVTHH